MLKKTLFILLCFTASAVVQADEQTSYKQFFEEYQRLVTEFDASLSTLYANDAKIMGVRKQADDEEASMTIDGKRWKAIIQASMERAKNVGDRSDYSDIVIDVDGDSAKISATRYSQLRCFTDTRFYMVVSRNEEGELAIVEQLTESSEKSHCEKAETSATELSEFLQSTVEMINEQLPATIDAETQLIKTSAEGTNLVYHYVLLNYTSETLSSEEATSRLQPIVINQSCGSPNMRPILDQEGSISYIYKGSDAVQIAKLDVDISACKG